MLTVIVAYAFSDKAAIHLFLNGFHTPWQDDVMRCYTVVGEWIPYVVVVLLLFYKAGWGMFLLADVALSGVLAQAAKYMADADRPYRWFANHYPDVQLPFVEGVRLSKFYSFPSGHTTTFFCLFMVLALVLTSYAAHQRVSRSPVFAYSCGRPHCLKRHLRYINALIATLCFLLAALGAYSRIYLSQHFLEDIFGGVFIGVFSTFILLLFVPRLRHTRFWNWRPARLRNSGL